MQVNLEKGFLYLQLVSSQKLNSEQNMKKNSFFAALFLCSLALITHNAP